MLFDFNYFLRMFEIIASGFKNTLSLSVISLFFLLYWDLCWQV